VTSSRSGLLIAPSPCARERRDSSADKTPPLDWERYRDSGAEKLSALRGVKPNSERLHFFSAAEVIGCFCSNQGWPIISRRRKTFACLRPSVLM
jgi:hypothetical protein